METETPKGKKNKTELENASNRYQLNWEITEAMMRFGGSFVKDLGMLWRRGDLSNRRKLEDAFSEYWESYKRIVEIKRAEKKEWYDR